MNRFRTTTTTYIYTHPACLTAIPQLTNGVNRLFLSLSAWLFPLVYFLCVKGSGGGGGGLMRLMEMRIFTTWFTFIPLVQYRSLVDC